MALHVKPRRPPSDGKLAAIEEAGKEELTRITVPIPKGTHRRLRLLALDDGDGDGATLNAIVNRAIDEYLSRRSDAAYQSAADAVSQPAVSTANLFAALERPKK